MGEIIEMTEKIGNVILNLESYCGKDLYSDGEIEDVLLDIVKSSDADNYDQIIYAKKSWPILYHLSDIRKNIINWYPIKTDSKILEVGAGCGAITGELAEKAAKVTAIELSKKRSSINANRNKKYDNIEILVGNFEDIQGKIKDKYNYITLIGVFEYAQCYINSGNPFGDFLNKINNLLEPDGEILIAIENRLGMKYFAGCREDHTGNLFEGIEGYRSDGVKTFSKKELETVLIDNGFNEYKFYYPYPDYKLPTMIYSDDMLPKTGELVNSIRNYDQSRFVLFDESKAFDGIIKAGLFQEFSNSYFVSIKKR